MNVHIRDILCNRFVLFSLFFLSSVMIGKFLSYETVEAACLAGLILLLVDTKERPSSSCSLEARPDKKTLHPAVVIKPRVYDENFMEYIDKRIDQLEKVKPTQSSKIEKATIKTLNPQAIPDVIRLPEPLPKKPSPNLSIQIVTK